MSLRVSGANPPRIPQSEPSCCSPLKCLIDLIQSCWDKFSSLLCCGRTQAPPRAISYQNPRQAHWNQQMAAVHQPSIFGQSVNLAGPGPAAPHCNVFHMDCVPQIGRYDANYDTALSTLTIRLPRSQLAHFPEPIRQRFAAYNDNNLDLFFVIYTDSYMCEGSRKRNLLLHPAVFPNIQDGDDIEHQINMGLFDPIGIEPSPIEPIAFNNLTPQRVWGHIHNGGMAMSPDNAQFIISNDTPTSSFFSAAELPGNRAMASFALIVHDERSPAGAAIGQAGRQNTLQGYLRTLQSGGLPQDLLQKINRLLTFQP